ncbi:MAG TPA: Uma2 family endonuclease [Coleofasciculaceae cyanobacterium]|jgi:Uma2 family endonuclease
MVQALQKLITFDEFTDWLPESSEYRHELHRGVIIEMPKPRGKHSLVAGLTAKVLNNAIDAAQLPYVIPKECIVRSADGASGYEPDVIVLDEQALVDEPQWESGSILTAGKSIKLIVEVVSSNWRDDYFTKQGEYEALGIQEFWIVEYLGLGGRRYIGNPKRPTFTVLSLVDGEYEPQLFHGGDRVVSPTFPDLVLTAEQAFGAAS